MQINWSTYTYFSPVWFLKQSAICKSEEPATIFLCLRHEDMHSSWKSGTYLGYSLKTCPKHRLKEVNPEENQHPLKGACLPRILTACQINPQLMLGQHTRDIPRALSKRRPRPPWSWYCVAQKEFVHYETVPDSNASDQKQWIRPTSKFLQGLAKVVGSSFPDQQWDQPRAHHLVSQGWWGK